MTAYGLQLLQLCRICLCWPNLSRPRTYATLSPFDLRGKEIECRGHCKIQAVEYDQGPSSDSLSSHAL